MSEKEERFLSAVLATPRRCVFQGRARAVTVPGHDGELGILPGHAPLAGLLGGGEVRLRTEGGTERYFLSGGFFSVAGDRVLLCAEEVFLPEEVSYEEASRRMEQAGYMPTATEEQYQAAQREIRKARAFLRFVLRAGKRPVSGHLRGIGV